MLHQLPLLFSRLAIMVIIPIAAVVAEDAAPPTPPITYTLLALNLTTPTALPSPFKNSTAKSSSSSNSSARQPILQSLHFLALDPLLPPTSSVNSAGNTIVSIPLTSCSSSLDLRLTAGNASSSARDVASPLSCQAADGNDSGGGGLSGEMYVARAGSVLRAGELINGVALGIAPNFAFLPFDTGNSTRWNMTVGASDDRGGGGEDGTGISMGDVVYSLRELVEVVSDTFVMLHPGLGDPSVEA